MGMFKGKPQNEKEEATEPIADPAEQKEVVTEEKSDRSAYNCTNCKGEGLVYEGINAQKCPLCHGTGKVN